MCLGSQIGQSQVDFRGPSAFGPERERLVFGRNHNAVTVSALTNLSGSAQTLLNQWVNREKD